MGIKRKLIKFQMISITRYLNIAEKYGHFASWAIWKEQGDKPKSNIGELTIFDNAVNPAILELVNPNYIIVGLNISRPIAYKFGNFHDKRTQSQDYKLRYTLKGTILSGAYMTDIIKDFENVISGEVMIYLKRNVDFEKKNIEIFIHEIKDIGTNMPILIALGNHVHSILVRNFEGIYPILKFPHYSMQISKENYKSIIDNVIQENLSILK